MKRTMAGIDMLVAAVCMVYMYVLVKIILFKFGEVNVWFLLHQAKRAIADADRLHNEMRMANIEPLRTISGNLHSGSLYEYIQFFGNIGLFLPLGMFLAYFMRNWKPQLLPFGTAIAASFTLTLLLESVQLLCTIGSFDVDDLILNTAGGVMGFVLYRSIARVVQRFKPIAPLQPSNG